MLGKIDYLAARFLKLQQRRAVDSVGLSHATTVRQRNPTSDYI